MKNYQVVHVIQSLGGGGAERVVFDLVAGLPEHGYEAIAVSITGGGPLEKLFQEESVPLYPIRARRPFGTSTFYDLVKIFRELKPSIVHTHLFTADTMGRLAARWAGIPHLVTTEHNTNPTYSRTKHWVNHRLSSITDAHIAVSEEVKRVMEKKDGIRSDKIQVIHNGVDMRHRPLRGTHPFHDIPRLLIVGRLDAQKDHATLLKALALVHIPWRLQIAGSGPLEKSLHALAERLHIASRIDWLGFRDDVPDLLASSDLLCFPSQYEGLGLAVVEAAVTGLPVIASDLPPLHEIFRATDVCFAPPGDVPAWAAVIRETLERPTQAIQMAQNALPRVQKEMSLEKMVRSYAKLYDELLTKKS